MQAAVLKRLVEMSGLQRRLASEGRVDELLAASVERDELFAALDLSCDSCRERLRPLARELEESDRVLADAVRSMMEGIGARLGQVKTGMSAIKAYGRY